ncbi:hypothetical protein BV25DRAFT_126845 [Artomyces pyxidatus]|uniref:Uncharacterized protein n=1 Tax=Artomyces pyxidatus TaxID=48021 RepID=A0ACB8TAM5_9AGAM|nr:hypothetical protein BV25DRAFT_126845 [Artomyces pyxidatus]
MTATLSICHGPLRSSGIALRKAITVYTPVGVRFCCQYCDALRQLHDDGSRPSRFHCNGSCAGAFRWYTWNLTEDRILHFPLLCPVVCDPNLRTIDRARAFSQHFVASSVASSDRSHYCNLIDQRPERLDGVFVPARLPSRAVCCTASVMKHSASVGGPQHSMSGAVDVSVCGLL